MSDALFDSPTVEREPVVPISVDRRRTLRNEALLARGLHPVSRRALRGQGTCGECSHCCRNGRYIKCDLNATNGPGTDIRLKWPACVSFSATPKEPERCELQPYGPDTRCNLPKGHDGIHNTSNYAPKTL